VAHPTAAALDSTGELDVALVANAGVEDVDQRSSHRPDRGLVKDARHRHISLL
jgi:hypothetical protein